MHTIKVGFEMEQRWKNYRNPKPTAEQLHAAALMTAPPYSMKRLAAWLGARVVTDPTLQWSGMLTFEPHPFDDSVRGPIPTIYLNGRDGFYRRRFTLAHEIGHLMLHNLKTAWRDNDFGGHPDEWEANRFAADLLIPKVDLHYDVNGRASLSQLALKYQVSRRAMEVRLESLGYL